jgi:hypothetical protein
LTQDFASYMAQKGMVVDVAIHAPDAKNDERNFHVHMLLTMRALTPDGFGNKVRAWNKDTALLAWKEKWSELGANHLERAGFGLEADRFRVGHLTLQRQREAAVQRGDHEWAEALDRTPGKHMGPHASAMEKQGTPTEKGEINREIKERNDARAKERSLTRTAGEIRLAYQLTDRAQAFADALEDRGLILARVDWEDQKRLIAIDKKKFTEKEEDHIRKLAYLARRTAEEAERDPSKSAELRRRRVELDKQYQDSLPWFMRTGGTGELSPDQKAAARRAYDKWDPTERLSSFEDYVAYVQEQWRQNPWSRSRFIVDELVVVDREGEVYALTQRNTGEDPKNLRKYIREIETAPLFNVRGAWEILKAVHDHRREEALWPEREKAWPINPPEPRLVRTSTPDLFERAGESVTRDSRRLEAPPEINKPRSLRFHEQPDRACIWEAYNRHRQAPGAFVEALEDEGILLCRVTKSEADRSYRNATFSRAVNHYSPRYREGEIVAMASDGRIYRIDDRNTDGDPKDIERFLKRLDRRPLPGIEEGTKITHQQAEAQQATAELMKRLFPIEQREYERSLGVEIRILTHRIRYAVSKGVELGEETVRTGGKVLRFGFGVLEALFATRLTPEQRRDAEIAEFERRKRAAEQAQQQLRGTDHER